MIEIIDDFLPISYQTKLESLLKSKDFPWYFYEQTSPMSAADYNRGVTVTDSRTLDNPQFVHVSFFKQKNTDLFEHFYPVVFLLEQHKRKSYHDRLLRIKANLVYKRENYPADHYNTPHVDDDAPTETLLYYVNESDGDTFIFNNEARNENRLSIEHRISPKKGRAILFDSRILHAGSPPTKTETRIVLNFMFHKE